MKVTYPFTEAESLRAYDEWGANCGPNALAFALQTTLDAVRLLIPEFEQKRYTSPGMMKAALSNARQKYTDILPATKGQMCAVYLKGNPMQLVRIQWTGPWTEPLANPKWAYRQTHWIAAWWDMKRGEMIFDCNGGIRGLDSWEAAIVPLITRSIPRADGGWFPTHIWRLEGGAE